MKGFKIILQIMRAVIACDAIAAIYFLHSWLAGVALAAILFTIYRLMPPKKAEMNIDEVEGWKLNEALELTDPHNPTRIKCAVVTTKILNLGVLLIGGPGSGKTIASLSFLKSLRPGLGWLYGEGKGDTDIYRMCVAMDIKVRLFYTKRGFVRAMLF